MATNSKDGQPCCLCVDRAQLLCFSPLSIFSSSLSLCVCFAFFSCTPNVQSIYSSLHSPLRASDLQSTWHEGFSNTFRFSISRSPYARLVAFYDRLVVEKDIVSDMDQTWNKRLTTLGSFFEFIVGPVRMYHFSMTPTAGGDIGRHPGKSMGGTIQSFFAGNLATHIGRGCY